MICPSSKSFCMSRISLSVLSINSEVSLGRRQHLRKLSIQPLAAIRSDIVAILVNSTCTGSK